MTTNKMIAFVFFILAIVLFVLIGFNIVRGTEDFNLLGLGLGSFAIGYVIQHYLP